MPRHMAARATLRSAWYLWALIKWGSLGTFVYGQGERIVAPADVPAYMRYNEGVRLQSQGYLDDALQAYQDAINLKPDLAEAYINAGTLLLTKADSADMALRLFERALEAADTPELRSNALNNMGHVRYTVAGSDYGAIEASLEDYQLALRENPRNVDAWYNMGKSLEDLGRLEDSRAAIEQVLLLDPEHPSAHLNLGNYHLFQGRDDEALAHHQHVINSTRASPREVRSALSNMGQLYRLRNDPARAEAVFRECMRWAAGTSDGDASSPDGGRAMATANIMVAHRSMCSWAELEDLQGSIRRHLDETLSDPTFRPRNPKAQLLSPYDALLVPQISSEQHLRLTRAYLSPLESISRCRPTDSSLRHPPRLRLSYLSYDYRDHAMGFLTQDLLNLHDPERFLVQAGSYGPPDNSSHRARIRAGVEAFTELQGLGEVEAACQGVAAGFQPHIVIDLMGLTRGTRTGLIALRPAPLVASYLGYPSTMGASFVDYSIVDRVVAPVETSAKAFGEHLVLLPHSYQANSYDPSLPSKLLPSHHDEEGEGREGHRPVLCNFNHVDKIEPVSFAVWMATLRRLPSASLLLLEPSGPSAAQVVRNLKLEAAANGVLPDRVVFLPRVSKVEHVRRMTRCHLFVDTFAYGAHSTASDALYSGVPLVSMPGWGGGGDVLGKFQGRVGASLLRALGQEHSLAYSTKELEDLTVRLASSRTLLDHLVTGLIGASVTSQAFHAPSITGHLQRAYQAMWDIYEAGLAPQHIIIHPTDPPTAPAATADLLVERAVVALQMGNNTEALAITARLTSGYSNSADAWHLHGLALLSLDRAQPAADSIMRAIRLRADVDFYYSNLAEALVRAGRKEEAQSALYRCLSSSTSPEEGIGAAVRLQALLNEAGSYVEEQALFRRVAPRLVEKREVSSSDLEVSKFLQQHAVALAGDDKADEAVEVLRAAVTAFPHDYRAALRLASALEAVGQNEEAIDCFLSAVRMKQALEHQEWSRSGKAELVERLRGQRRTTKRTRVALWCDEYGQSWWGQWGPSSLGKGLGGSEEAVVFIARELARTGRFHVEVYGNPPDQDIGYDGQGVLWLPSSSFDPSGPAPPPDIFIAWRYHISLALSEGSPLRYLWLQDVPSTSTYTARFLEHSRARGIFVLSLFHAQQLPCHAQPLALVTPNALDPHYLLLNQGLNKPHVFAYGSAPNRGLELLLRLWPRIRAGLKVGAPPELRVYYGFTSAFEAYAKRSMGGEAKYQEWKHVMESLLDQEGVRYLGMVDHMTLARGYAEAGFWLYPTTYPETGCVTAMKAMAHGALPITSRWPESTLPELTEPFDMGPRALRVEDPASGGDVEWLDLYVQAVVNAANLDFKERGGGAVGRRREEMVRHARRNFLWENVAGIWEERFRSDAQMQPTPSTR